MAMMCKLGSKCCATKGMCIHEKVMLLMIVVAVPLAGHFLLGWF